MGTKYIQNKQNIYKCIQSTYGIYIYIWSVYKVNIKYVWSMYEVYMKYTHIYIYKKYVQSIYKVYTKSIKEVWST